MRKVIIDFDGTLTCEELQAAALAERSLSTLATEILHVPKAELDAAYEATQMCLLAAPHRYGWSVNGLLASYCDEGAFILNTTVLQTMLNADAGYRNAVSETFHAVDYDPVMECVNYLFHHHTAKIRPTFRPQARQLLDTLVQHPGYEPLVLTNSLSDKVSQQLSELKVEITVLGDTRQYAMDPSWAHSFRHPVLGQIQVWPIDKQHEVDLRRPAYYRALRDVTADGSSAIVVADTLSLPGALPLLMDIPFCQIKTPYTPKWCERVVADHPLGYVLQELKDLYLVLESLDGERA